MADIGRRGCPPNLRSANHTLPCGRAIAHHSFHEIFSARDMSLCTQSLHLPRCGAWLGVFRAA